MSLLGQGSFSRVYSLGADQVIIYSSDPVKECMSLDWFPKTPLFPNITRLEANHYRMKRYPKIRAPKRQLNTKAYELYKALKEYEQTMPGHKELDSYQTHVKHLATIPSKFNREKAHISAAFDALANYGEDTRFEISPRNITKTQTGKLVLLDCFYFISALLNTRQSKNS